LPASVVVSYAGAFGPADQAAGEAARPAAPSATTTATPPMVVLRISVSFRLRYLCTLWHYARVPEPNPGLAQGSSTPADQRS